MLAQSYGRFKFIPFRFQRITRRQGGGDEAYFKHTLRKPTTMPTKLAKECGLVKVTALQAVTTGKEKLIYYALPFSRA